MRRRLVLALIFLFGSVAIAHAYLPANIENTVKSWFNSAGKLIGFRLSVNNSPPVPKTGTCDIYVNSSGDLVSACNGQAATTLISGSVLGCLQSNGVMSCIAFVSADQNTLPSPAANYFKMFDNDVDLTPSPSCADYGQSGLITVMDTNEGAADRYVLCDGTTEVDVWNAAVARLVPFGISTSAGSASEPADDDDCLCWMFSVTTAMAALEKITFRAAAIDADDTIEIAVYSEDGLTQLFEGAPDIDATPGIGYKTVTNDISPAPPLPRGDYWYCLGHNQANTNDWAVDAAFAGQYQYGATLALNEACPAAEMPATITVSSPTWAAATVYPAIVLTDE